ncbi:MAG: twin-arginine translocase subunit TatC [Nitrosopumilus sp.]|nr:twin-arginine translocase subunit TatC [Nitrosopumilus sp.]
MVAKVSEDKSNMKFFIELRRRLIRISISVIVIISLSMTMSITIINFGDYKIPILYPDTFHSISAQIISFMKDTLLPKSVSLIQVAPGQAFTAQIYVAIVSGIIFSIPIIFRELIAFIGPALHYREKKVIQNLVLPSISLFVAGCFFSYYIVIPYTIEFLYKYGVSMDVTSFFDITQFISFVVHLLLIFGLSYQFPLIIWVLTKTKITKPQFWRSNFRYVIIIIVIIGAIITPDGSGITMWFVVGPMLLLYLIGILIIELRFGSNGLKKYNIS